MKDSCTDCGLEPAHGVVMLAQTQVVNKRTIHLRRCGRCWIKAGADARDERAEKVA